MLGKLVATAAATVAVTELLRRILCRSTDGGTKSSRVIVAVSGTIQDGFELRKNIDYTAEGEVTVRAVLLGYGVARGAKMYFDIKDRCCREFDPAVPHRVNPAMVLTGDRNDANLYALYLVDERACLNALLGEPRLLTMTPDALRIDLEDPATSPEVAKFARAVVARDGKAEYARQLPLPPSRCTQFQPSEAARHFETSAGGSMSPLLTMRARVHRRLCAHRTNQVAVLAVVSSYRSSCFVAAPPMQTRADGTRLTSFRQSLGAFASIGQGVEPGTKGWNDGVAKALTDERNRQEALPPSASPLPSSSAPAAAPNDSLYGTNPQTTRLSRRMSAAEFDAICDDAGLTLRAGR